MFLFLRKSLKLGRRGEEKAACQQSQCLLNRRSDVELAWVSSLASASQRMDAKLVQKQPPG